MIIYSLLNNINMPKKEDIELIEKRLSTTLNYLKEQDLSSQEIVELVNKLLNIQVKEEVKVPLSVFKNDYLGSLETIVKYLKEELNLRFHEIAVLLNRDDRTIWASYKIACKKRKEKLSAKESKFFIPVYIFTHRKFGVLEAIVGYLKDNFKLRYSEIAELLNRDERNIWTAYNHYKRKK